MFKKQLFLLTLCLFLISANKLFSLIIIDADIIGYSNVRVKVLSPKNAYVTIERKEASQSYHVIGRARSIFNDTTTKKNTLYTYRVKLANDVSNNVKINTRIKRVLLKSHKIKPFWVFKTSFNTKNYHFNVVEFKSGYSEESKLKKQFLINLIKYRVNSSIQSRLIKNKLMAFFKNSLTASSLKSLKPYREKIIEYGKNSNRIYTATKILYGIAKKDVQHIINAGLCILKETASDSLASAKKLLLNPSIRKEPALALHLNLIASRKGIENNIIAAINNLRMKKGLKSLKCKKINRNTYVFGSVNSSKSNYRWQGGLYSLYNKVIKQRDFEQSVANTLESRAPAIFSDYVTMVSVNILLETKNGNADLKITLNLS